MSYIDIEIAYRIRDARESKGYSREYFEEISGVTARFLFDVEAGRKDITVSTLKKICRALDVTPNYLLHGQKSNKEEILYMLQQMDSYQEKLALDLLQAVLKNPLNKEVNEV